MKEKRVLKQNKFGFVLPKPNSNTNINTFF